MQERFNLNRVMKSNFRKHFPAECGLLRQAERSEVKQIQHSDQIKGEDALQIF